MNSLFEAEFPLHETHIERYELLDALTDTDLDYALPGDNPSLGELLRQVGETEYVYVQSYTSGTMDWSYRNTNPNQISNIEALNAWYRSLDADFAAAISRLKEEDLNTPSIDRGGGFVASPYVQFQIFREALYIYLGKASVYLKAMRRNVSDRWQAGIG